MLGNYWGHDAFILEGSVKGDACYTRASHLRVSSY